MVTENFKIKVVQYCLDQGTGIEYEEFTGGYRNLTTDKEVAAAEKEGRAVRFVDYDAIEYFLDEYIIAKTEYVIDYEEKTGKSIDLIDFDEWVALCNIFGNVNMKYEDALKINGILYEYDITPMEYMPEAEFIPPKAKFIPKE